MPGVSEVELAEAAQYASLADETPEGRSIVVLAKQYGIREHELSAHDASFVPFTAETRMSGVDLNGSRIRKGAGDAILALVVERRAARRRPSCSETMDRIGREGGTPLAVARDNQVLGVDLPQGRGQGGDERALRPAAGDGHPHGDGHRRQPADRGEDRRASPGSTTSSPRRRRSASSS